TRSDHGSVPHPRADDVDLAAVHHGVGVGVLKADARHERLNAGDAPRVLVEGTALAHREHELIEASDVVGRGDVGPTRDDALVVRARAVAVLLADGIVAGPANVTEQRLAADVEVA